MFLPTSHKEKIRRLLAMGKSLTDAEDLVDNVDKERGELHRALFQCGLADAEPLSHDDNTQ